MVPATSIFLLLILVVTREALRRSVLPLAYDEGLGGIWGVSILVERGPFGWDEGGSRAPAGPVPGSMWPRSDRCWLHACTDGGRHRRF